MPTKKKKRFNARFPPARIKKIMQSDEDVGKVAAPVPVIISRAVELFTESLMKKVNEVVAEKGASTIKSGHIKHCVNSEARFDFLRELCSTAPDLPDAESSSGAASNSGASDVAQKNFHPPLPPPPPRIQRQLSTPRPRRVFRKSSAETRRRYVDEASDEENDLGNGERRVQEEKADTKEFKHVIEAVNKDNNDEENNGEKQLAAPQFTISIPGGIPGAPGGLVFTNGAQILTTTAAAATTTTTSNANLLSSGIEIDEDYDA